VTPLPAGEREGPKPQAWEGEGKPVASAVPSPCRRSAPAVPLPCRERGWFRALLAHEENSWRARVDIPLAFLLGTVRP
jgi:hypothetical protein